MNKRRAFYWVTIEVLASLFASLVLVCVIGTYTNYFPNFIEALHFFGVLALSIAIGFPLAIGALALFVNFAELIGIIGEKFSAWSKKSASLDNQESRGKKE
jgi:uncharacterized membrane protein YbhN (UPF0104 family)